MQSKNTYSFKASADPKQWEANYSQESSRETEFDAEQDPSHSGSSEMGMIRSSKFR